MMRPPIAAEWRSGRAAADEVLQALAQCSPAFLSGAAVDDEGERVDRLAIDENVEQDDVALLVAIDL